MKQIWKTATIFGLLSGMLSLTALIQQYVKFGSTGPLNLVVGYYHKLLQAVLGWADEPLRQFLVEMGRLVRVDVALSPDWKDIFVLLWLYFSADAITNWNTRKLFAICSWSLGFIIALATSGVIGAGHASGALPALLLSLIPMLGVFVFELTRTGWVTALKLSTPSMPSVGKSRSEILAFCFVSYDLPIVFAALVALAFGSMLSQFFVGDVVETAFTPLVLIFFLIAVAVLKLLRGVKLAATDRLPSESWYPRLMRSGSTELGFRLLVVISGAVVFLILNAGL